MHTPDTWYTRARPHAHMPWALSAILGPSFGHAQDQTHSGLHFPAPSQEGSPSRAVCFQAVPPSSGITCTQAQFPCYPAPPLGPGEGGLESPHRTTLGKVFSAASKHSQNLAQAEQKEKGS